MTDFAALNLLSPILSALHHAGYTQPTPIQAQAIPHLQSGRDLLGIAQTGTGKTAAFALPILDRLGRRQARSRPGHARALILAPTRELASQIDASFAAYGARMQLSRALVFGGVNQHSQVRAMVRGVDLLVATPGRLLDLMGQGVISLERLEVFVLDEADRMLDMGFIHDIHKVIAKLPPTRQTLLFSATMPKEIASLAESLLQNPVRVEVAPTSTTVDRVEQKVYLVEKGHKILLLKDVLQNQTVRQALVFTRTKHGADRLADTLGAAGVEVSAIHGNKSQNAREAALNGFRNGRLRVLVATDIAARGLDVPGVSHVINFDLPNEPESYVHRIGRTARAGRDGMAISFCDTSERGFLRDIERTIRCSVRIDAEHPYHSGAAEALPAKSGPTPTKGKAKSKTAKPPATVGAAEPVTCSLPTATRRTPQPKPQEVQTKPPLAGPDAPATRRQQASSSFPAATRHTPQPKPQAVQAKARLAAPDASAVRRQQASSSLPTATRHIPQPKPQAVQTKARLAGPDAPATRRQQASPTLLAAPLRPARLPRQRKGGAKPLTAQK
ncbi:MAG: DEAD/DEAH box helicase [Magnetococcales bacterium]|nr:DEAD/DEAH box helicase [Magnetococcales bacterium]